MHLYFDLDQANHVYYLLDAASAAFDALVYIYIYILIKSYNSNY